MKSLSTIAIFGACLSLLAAAACSAEANLPQAETDPLHVTCPNFEARPASAPIGFDAWRKGEDRLHIEGGGAFGTNMGHTNEALAWFCKAVEAGNARAAYDIGLIVEVGYIINKRLPSGQIISTNISGDRMGSFYWYELAAKQGYPLALLTVGWFHVVGPAVLHGSTVEKDVGKGLAIIISAADKGDTRAQLMLAYAYAPGFNSTIPVTKDAATAIKWMSKAQSRLSRYRSVCTDPVMINRMLGRPSTSPVDRSIVRVDIQVVHGDDDQICSVDLGTGRNSNQGGIAERMTRAMQGTLGDESLFDIVSIPGTDQKFPRPETATQSLSESSVKLAPLLAAFGKTWGK